VFFYINEKLNTNKSLLREFGFQKEKNVDIIIIVYNSVTGKIELFVFLVSVNIMVQTTYIVITKCQIIHNLLPCHRTREI